MDGSAHGRRIVVRRWAPLVLACLAGVALTSYDQRLKSGSFPPYAPQDAVWLATAPNAPTLWTAFSETDAGQAINEELSRRLNEVSLAVRKATGIRPTPRRWRIWLGGPVLAGKTADGWGLCVRPGLLLRMADWALGTDANMPGVRQFGSCFYAWKDGCLIAASKASYVQAALTAPPRPWPALEADALQISHLGTPEAQVVVRAAAGIPMQASLQSALPLVSGPLDLRVWPRSPLAVLTATNGATLEAGLAAIFRNSGLAARWSGLDPVWRQRLELGWHLPAFHELLIGIHSSTSMALFPLDLTESLPLPAVALAWDRDALDSAMALGQTLGAVPYAWNDCSGWLAPYLYQALAPCWCEERGQSLIASREQLMAQLAGRTDPGSTLQGVFALKVDWSEVSGQLAELLMKALQLGLVPGVEERTAMQEAQPWLNTLRRMGQLELTADESNGALVISGHASLVPAP